jgi:hypothetical protein
MNDVTKARTRTEAQQMGFERARDARSTMQISPIERHRQKVHCALRWIHGWNQSTADLIKKACRSSSLGFLSSMKSNGWVRTERVLGQTFWLLTKQGVDFLRSLSGPDDVIAQLNAARGVNLYAFHHDAYAQRLLAELLKRSPPTGAKWLPERALRARFAHSAEGAKCPDAMYSDSVGTVYLEVERSKKKQPALEVMLLNAARLIENQPKARVEIHIGTGIADRYRSTHGSWVARREFRSWGVSTDGELFEGGRYSSTESLHDAFLRIKLIDVKSFT